MSLRDRLLAMLVEEGSSLVTEGSAEEATSECDSPAALEMSPSVERQGDFLHLDERVKKDLFDLGFEEFSDLCDHQEDDPICSELRSLQRQLLDQVCLNHYRKKKFAELVKSKLPAQEFYALLSDIDKQIEHLYQRRARSGKKKRKTGPTGSSTNLPSPGPPLNTIPPEATKLLETRTRLVSSFSGIIPSLKEMLASSKENLFSDEEEKRVLALAAESGNWLPVPEVSSMNLRPRTQPVFPSLGRV